MKDKNILIALDFDDIDVMYQLVDQLDPSQCRLKVGKELFTRFGPDLVRQLQAKGFDIFLDLKFHDIPNTVAKAVASAAELGVWMVNVHASGGSKMISAAKEALKPYGDKAPLLIAVTVLTSMSQDDLDELGLPTAAEQVAKLAQLAAKAGADGVVCSALEAATIKQLCGDDFVTVTPGIRPQGSSTDDQQRTMTPSRAVANGADYLVIGRPITQAKEPMTALSNIHAELTA